MVRRQRLRGTPEPESDSSDIPHEQIHAGETNPVAVTQTDNSSSPIRTSPPPEQGRRRRSSGPIEELQAFRADVFRIIATIPSGKVTTYGHIARLAGYPRHSRHVGRALQTLSAEDEREAGGTVPWQRVINSRGRISLRVPSGSVDRQAEILRAEGVDVQLDPLEMYFVSLKEYGWFPDRGRVRARRDPPHGPSPPDAAENEAGEEDD